MSLLDTLLGKPPEPYEPEDDPLSKVEPLETRSLPLLARRSAERHVALKRELSDVAQEVYGTRKLLVIIIALLILNKVIDVSVLTSLVGG